MVVVSVTMPFAGFMRLPQFAAMGCIMYLNITILYTIIFIGASLSDPHTSESNSAPVSVWYVCLTESRNKILILCIAFYCLRASRQVPY